MMTQKEIQPIKCNACQKKPVYEINYMVLKTRCSAQRIPLCRVCYDKQARKK